VFDAASFLADLGLRADTQIFFSNHHFAHALPSLFFTDWDDALLYTADGSGDQVYYSHNLFRDGALTNLYGDDRWLTLPEAIRKMTSAPAARLRLEGRGHIEAGAIADLVLFNANTIADRSTFTDPAVLPIGVEKVFIGGELAWDNGKPAPARPGKVLMSGHTPAETDAGAYRLVPNWGTLPAGLQFGEVPGMTIDDAGRVFAFTRAEPPVIEFDPSGKVLKTWGEKMFVWPHGIRVDRDGFLWITDGRAANGRGQQVFKFDRTGKLLMTLGTKGIGGETDSTFNGPCDVAVAANGDIFVAEPVTHANAALNEPEERWSELGMRVLGPGEEMSLQMRLEVIAK